MFFANPISKVYMDTEKINSLKCEIIKCKRKLAELEPQIESNVNIQKIYNKILIKKAVLVQKYKKIQQKPSIKDKIKKLLKIYPRKKLICDYFKTSEI